MLNTAISMAKRQLVDSIWKSAGIEGLGTTFPNTEAILENLPVTTTRDEMLFIVNMKRAWYFIIDNVEYPNTLSLLREINKVCMTGLTADAGKLRNYPVNIGGTTWMPEFPNESVIVERLQEIDDVDNKIDSALEMFCYLARVQMFGDGNKRLAQLMCNKILMQYDVGILSIPYDKISTFKEKLVSYYETGDRRELTEFLCSKCLLMNPEYVKDDMEKYAKHVGRSYEELCEHVYASVPTLMKTGKNKEEIISQFWPIYVSM